MKLRLVGLGFGALFGFTLGWAGLTDYDVIHDMLLLRHPDVFLLMGSAIVTGLVGSRILKAFRAKTLLTGEFVTWAKPRLTRDHIVGSILFGLGWSVACTCPGPVASQLGRGQFAALFTGAGLLGGAWLRDNLLRHKDSVPLEAGGPCAAADPELA